MDPAHATVQFTRKMQCLIKRGRREQDGKFVAADPEETVTRSSELLAYMSRDFTQDTIAKGMAVAIVDALEVVDIEKAQGGRLTLAGRGQQLLELGAVMASIERAREIVGDRQSAQAPVLS